MIERILTIPVCGYCKTPTLFFRTNGEYENNEDSDLLDLLINQKTEKMNKLIKFGENVEGYDIPVLNEREIRASAGLFFLAVFIAIMLIVFKQNFLMVKYVITIFFTDFIIRVF